MQNWRGIASPLIVRIIVIVRSVVQLGGKRFFLASKPRIIPIAEIIARLTKPESRFVWRIPRGMKIVMIKPLPIRRLLWSGQNWRRLAWRLIPKPIVLGRLVTMSRMFLSATKDHLIPIA